MENFNMMSPVLPRKALCLLATQNEHKAREVLTLFQGLSHPSLPIFPMAGYVSPEESGLSFRENARLKAWAGVSQLQACIASSHPQNHPLYRTLQACFKEEGTYTVYMVAEDAGMCVDAPPPEGYLGPLPWPGVWSNRWVTPEFWRRWVVASSGLEAPCPYPVSLTDTHRCIALKAWQRQAYPNHVLSAYYQSTLATYPCTLRVDETMGFTLQDEALSVSDEPQYHEATLALTLQLPEEPLKGHQGFGYDPMTYPLGERRTCAELLPEEKARMSHRGKAWLAWLHAMVS
jgi:hypothetical protein